MEYSIVNKSGVFKLLKNEKCLFQVRMKHINKRNLYIENCEGERLFELNPNGILSINKDLKNQKNEKVIEIKLLWNGNAKLIDLSNDRIFILKPKLPLIHDVFNVYSKDDKLILKIKAKSSMLFIKKYEIEVLDTEINEVILILFPIICNFYLSLKKYQI